MLTGKHVSRLARLMNHISSPAEDLQSRHVLVLMALGAMANRQGECFPGVEHLCEVTRQSRRCVIQTLKDCKDMGAITQLKNGPGDFGAARGRPANRYRVDWMLDEQPQDEANKVHEMHLNGEAQPDLSAPDDDLSAPDDDLSATDDEISACGAPQESEVSLRGLRERGRKSRKRALPLPSDWRPDESLTEWAKAERADIDLNLATDNFIDYHLASGKSAADWDAKYRTWIRNERPQQATANPVADSYAGIEPPPRENDDAGLYRWSEKFEHVGAPQRCGDENTLEWHRRAVAWYEEQRQ